MTKYLLSWYQKDTEGYWDCKSKIVECAIENISETWVEVLKIELPQNTYLEAVTLREINDDLPRD